MALQAKRWTFTRSLLEDAPEHAGVYALWEKDRLVHLAAARGAETLRDRLLEHFEEAGGRITHYSWEICRQPLERLHQLFAQMEDVHAEVRSR